MLRALKRARYLVTGRSWATAASRGPVRTSLNVLRLDCEMRCSDPRGRGSSDTMIGEKVANSPTFSTAASPLQPQTP